ncbi:radical SAM protein [Plebeiibacterium marinum]|uniref:Radical SAM protein n=1 Tax=Plebeiibacterium marinum TaxID=2992111 RepID=A0AAE3MD13_9BACT|nr:radical SAM protein [Plebeiobacterium marinum]MCW3805528.1 radical SAM protein [Plebeiobacterium marinum]
MKAKYQWLNSLLTNNKNEFAQFPEIKWLNPYLADNYIHQRNHLLNKMIDAPLFKATKPYINHISKGCQICGSGKWSCLFITNKCNASCFYCPVPQKNDEVPSTQGLDFKNPLDYAHYVNNFGFDGVSFSGGEPLLYFDRTLEYLKILRQECKPDLYIWMYTNGILSDKSKFMALANENLNEIRFDIGATGFSLDKIKAAKGIIPVITIEIPSIPEEKDRLIAMMPQMVEAGVTNLNLHHLRLTQHNVSKLIKRDYNITSAERPLVVESEIAALEIINEAQNAGLKIGINYCSFHYKHRFQKAGYRRIIAKKIFPDAQITENGYIRTYNVDSIVYQSIKLCAATECLDNKHIEINGVNYGYKVSSSFTETNLSDTYRKQIDELIKNEPENPPADMLLYKIYQFEYIESGLRDY